jgi:hypothetical protein
MTLAVRRGGDAHGAGYGAAVARMAEEQRLRWRAGQRARARDGGAWGSEHGREMAVEKARRRWRTQRVSD